MKCPFPKSIRAPSIGYATQFIAVPCGECGICMRNKVSEWKIRLTEESKINIANSFITLTYNDENLPKDGVNKEHIQKFNKQLRNYYKYRYYYVSEYGPTTNRPHYHGILFGIDNHTDSEMVDKLEKIWAKGFVTLTQLEPTRINYVAEYHVLKNVNPVGSNPNFKLLSCKPAIGSNYINREKQFHWSEKEMYYRNGKFKLGLPRYYKEKIYDSKTRKRASALRQIKEDQNEIRSRQTDPLYYAKKQQNIKATIDNYIKRKIKKGKL